MVGKGLKLLIQEAHQFVKCQRLLELCVTLCHSASLLQNSFFVLRIAGLSQILVIALRHLSNSRSVPQAQVKQCVGAIRIIATSLFHELGVAVWNDVAFYSMAGGIIGALLAAVPGLIDLISISDSKAKSIGIWHMTINLL